MAVAIQVPGACLVKVDTGTLETLGYSRDGVIIRQEGYFLDVKTDDTGGEAGPGSDTQYLGEMAHISMELTKWDSAVAAKIQQRIKGAATLGTQTTATSGALMIANSYFFRVVLVSAALGRNYPTVVLREPMEINLGTKYSTLRIEGQAWQVSGLLFNSTLT